MKPNNKKQIYIYHAKADNIPFYPICYAMMKFTSKEYKKIVGYQFKKNIMVHNKDHTDFAFRIDDISNFNKHVINKLNKEASCVRKITKILNERSKKIIKLSKSIYKTDLSKKTNQELLNYYLQYGKLYKHTYLGWAIAQFTSQPLTEKIKKLLAKHYPDNKVNEYFILLSNPSQGSFINKEEIDLLKIAIKIKNNKKTLELFKKNKITQQLSKYKTINQLIDNHHKKYQWFPYNYIGPGWDKQYFVNQLKDLVLKKKINQKLKSLENYSKKTQKQQSQLIKKIKLNPKIKNLLQAMQDMTIILDRKKEIFTETHFYIHKLLEEISKKLNIPVKLIKFMTESDMEKALKQNKFNKQILEKRRNHSVSVCYPNKEPIFYFDQGAQKIIQQIKEEESQSKKVKGIPAYLGKVKGTIKIANNIKDVNKINKGDILVSVRTSADLIVAMQKASAFVTDEGGITCHAAVVAREMKKPCIVGTKNATKILKDGDKVEVDADKGIIKIIKKN